MREPSFSQCGILHLNPLSEFRGPSLIGDEIAIKDTEYRFLYQNKSHRERFGDSPGEYCYGATRNSDEICENCPLQMSFLDGKVHKEEQARMTNQGIEYYEVISAPIRSSAGEIIAGIEVVRDITARKKALAEKETLLQELNHRVKNNLNILSSLLKMQARADKDQDCTNILKEAEARIGTIALIHEKLCRSESLGNIEVYSYVMDLTKNVLKISSADSNRILIDLDIKEFMVPVNTAIALGLILNELLTNSIKHAFPNGSGLIIIKMNEKDGDKVELIYSDNGIGLPEDFDINKTDTLGMKLIDTLARQLGGDIGIRSEDGFEFSLIFMKSF
ncbi:MAG: histidine kinase dimerization/phosphoacceptor domain -containing protein [Nitrospirota bacterium]